MRKLLMILSAIGVMSIMIALFLAGTDILYYHKYTSIWWIWLVRSSYIIILYANIHNYVYWRDNEL